MLCPSCQSDIPLGSHFCSHCGHNLLETHEAYLEGLRAFCEGQYDLALRKFKVALLTAPTNPEVIKDCGHAFLHNGDLVSALEMYEKAEMLGGMFVDADYNRALALLRSNHFQEAHDLFARITHRADVAVRKDIYYLGLIFATTEQFLAQCHLHLGVCEMELGSAATARFHLEQAIELDATCLSAHKHLGDLAMRDGHYSEAIAHYEAVANSSSLTDEIVQARIRVGMACYDNGQIEDAVRHLTWVLRTDPQNPSAIHILNHIYEKEGIIDSKAGVGPMIPSFS